MNILYHHRTQGKGVERVHIMGIVEAWREQGHFVDTVSPPGVSLKDSGEPEQSRQASKGIWKRFLKYMPELVFEFIEFFYNVWAYLSIIKKVRAKPYDLIFERYSFLCFAALMVSKQNNIPYFLEVNYTSDTPIFRKRSRLIRHLERFIEKKIFKKADGIVVVSTYLKTLLLSIGISEEIIIVLPNAADPMKFHPNINSNKERAQLGLQDEKIIGFVGYFYPWHGVEFFVNAYPGISKYVKEVVFLLVGDGPLYSGISESVQKRNLANKVLLPGRIAHRDIPRYVSLFDVAVMPHSNIYGSPMKVLEYMAMGKAVVAPRLGPLKDVIEEGVNGLLFEPKNIKSLQEQLVRVLTDRALRENLGQAARNSIVEKHNWPKNASRIISLYENLFPETGEFNRI